MVHKKEEGTYHHIEKLMKEMPGFLSPGRGLPLLLIPEYSGINKEQRIPDRSKTAHRKPPVKCFLTVVEWDSVCKEFSRVPGKSYSVIKLQLLLLSSLFLLLCWLHRIWKPGMFRNDFRTCHYGAHSLPKMVTLNYIKETKENEKEIH